MAKKLNKNLVISLSAAGFLASTVVGVLMVHQMRQKDPEELVRRAQAAEEAGNWKDVAAFYMRAYQISDDPKYIVRAGDAQYESGREMDALRAYNLATITDPTLLEAQEKLLGLQLEIARMQMRSLASWESVKQTSSTILELEGQAEHPQALYGLGMALIGLRQQEAGNEAQGVEYLEKAVAARPGDVDFVTALAAHRLTTNRRDEANQLFEKLVELNTTPGKDATRARTQFAGFLARQNEHERAQKLYEEAQKLTGDDPEVRSTAMVDMGTWWLGRWQVKRQEGGEAAEGPEYANAVAALQQAVEAYPAGFDAYAVLAEAHLIKGEYDQGLEVCDRRLQMSIRREGLKAFINRTKRYALLLTAAELQLRKADAAPPGTEPRREMAEKADLFVEDALGEIADGPDALHTRGKIKLVLGKDLEAIRMFELAAEQARVPDWRNMYFLASARLQQGQIGAARDAIQLAMAQPGAAINCWNLYARILLQMDDTRDALAAVNQVLTVRPDDAEALVLKATAQARLGQTPAAEQTFQSITATTPALIGAQAEQLQAQGRTEEAVARITAALKGKPADPVLVQAAVRIYKSQNRPEDMHKVVQDALQVDPKSFDLKLIALRVEDKSTEEKKQAYFDLIQQEADEYLRAVRLAEYHREQGNLAEQYAQLGAARDLIIKGSTEEARKAGPNALRAIVDAMFVSAAQTNDAARLDAVVADAAKLNVDAAEGMTYRGRRLLVAGREAAQAGKEDEARARYNEAVDALKKALDKFPTNSDTLAQLGEAYIQLGRTDEARASFERAEAINPTSAMVVKRLAMLALSTGDQAAYKDRLDALQKLLPNDPWVAEQMLVEEEKSDPRKGIERRVKLREQNPEDMDNLLRLAQLYDGAGDKVAAEETLDAILAIRLDNQVAAVVAPFLRRMDKPEKALEVLKNNVRQAKDEDKPAAQLLIGAHYEDLRDLIEADTAYEAAADINANQAVCVALAQYFYRSSRFERSYKWLEDAQKLAEAGKSAEQASILRMRIETLLRLQRVDEAGKLCADYQARFPDDPASLYLTSELAVKTGDMQDAIAKLGLYLEKNPNHSLARFRRAQHYATLSEWQQSIKDLEQLRANSPTALVFAPRILLATAYERVGKLDYAIQELASAQAAHPEAVNVTNELINLYLRYQRYADADSLITQLLNQDPSNVNWMVKSGELALAQKDRSKSLSRLREAAVRSGYDADITRTLLDAYRQFQAGEQGVAFFEQTVPPDRRTPAILLSYANLLAATAQPEAAVETYRTALYRNGYGAFGFLQNLVLGMSGNLGGQPSLELLDKFPPEDVLKRADDHIRSALLHGLEQYTEALAVCQALLDSSNDKGEKVQLHLRIANSFESRKDFDQAKAHYELALSIDDQDLIVLNNLAYLLADKLKKPDLAIPYAERAARLSQTPPILDTLGWAYAESGRHRDAIAQLSQAKQIDPNYLPAAFHLAEVSRRSGQFTQAIKLFEEVLAVRDIGRYADYLPLAQSGLDKSKENRSD